MPDGIHTLNVGAITCTVIGDGTSQIPDIAELFPDVPSDELEAVVRGLGQHPSNITNSFNMLLIETDGQRVLVDTGLGDSPRDGLGLLRERMVAAGFPLETIDLVFITHFHGDHIAGLTNSDNAPNFPNARYACVQAEWDAWMSEEALANLPEAFAERLQAMMLPLKDKFTLLEFGDVIAPGVTAIDAKGHTAGHTALLIESEGETLFHMVDTLHRQLQFQDPSWSIRFDSQPDISPITRRELLQRSADNGWLTLFYHLPFPGLGHVQVEADGFKWVPIV